MKLPKITWAWTLAIALATTFSGQSQNWKEVGNLQAVMGPINEMDMTTDDVGDIHVVGRNGSTIKSARWDEANQTWISYPDMTYTNAQDVSIIVGWDEKPIIAFYAGSTPYIYLRKWNGTSWVAYGGTPYQADNTKQYDFRYIQFLGEFYLTFYNESTGLGVTNEHRVFRVNTTSLTAIDPDEVELYAGGDFALAINEDNDDIYAIHGVYDIGIFTQMSYHNGGSDFQSASGLGGSTDGPLFSEMDFTYLGATPTLMYAIIQDDSPYIVDMGQFNCNTNSFGASISFSFNSVELDMASSYTHNYVIAGTANTITIDKITSSNLASQSLGSPLFAPPASSRHIVEHDDRVGICFVDGNGDPHVFELDNPATLSFGNWNNFSVCEMTYGQHGQMSFTANDNNWDHSNISYQVQSNTPAVINTTNITLIQNGLEREVGVISEDVAATTTAELNIELWESGSLADDNQEYIEVRASQNITFASINTDVCTNDPLRLLMNYVTPTGGQWSGHGVWANKLHPGQMTPGQHWIYYSITDSTGCVATDSVQLTVYEAPSLAFATIDPECDSLNGSITLTIMGGSGTYDVDWNTGETGVTFIDSLGAGMYYAQVEDLNTGCSAMKAATLSSSSININGTPVAVSCNGGDDGQIFVNASGDAPFTYYWSDGQITANPIDLSAGSYEVEVEDANGCLATASYTVTEPAAISWTSTTTDASCGSNDGGASVSVSGGTGPYTYQWYDDMGVLATQTSATLSGVGQGYYSVLITDANGCSALWNTVISEAGAPVIGLVNAIQPTCGSLGGINIAINSSNGVASILWSNGATTEDITGLTGGYYSVEVEDMGGCVGMFGVELDSDLPDTLNICLVTVDQNTFTNRVVWEKPSSGSISHFNVYRETSVLGQYMLVDTVEYSSLSRFTDPIANPTTRSWRYKISVTDTCGNESDMSASHKTIHLVKNLGLQGHINLIWDEYEGFTYGQHRIWRYTDVDGWNAIDSVVATTFLYTDTAVPGAAQVLDYFIEVDPQQGCTASRAENYNSSRSNKTEPGIATPPVSIREQLRAEFMVYPNPTSDRVFIRMDGLEDARWVAIVDMQGKVVRRLDVNQIFGDLHSIDLSGLERGQYMIIMDHTTGIHRKPFVVQ